MQYRWAVELQRSGLNDRDLRSFLLGVEFSVSDGDEYRLLVSQKFERCADAAEVNAEAKRLRSAFTGVSGVDPDFVFGVVIDYSHSPPKKEGFIEVESSVVRTSMSTVQISLAPPSGLSEAELDTWQCEYKERQHYEELEKRRVIFEAAYIDSRVEKVMRLIESGEPSAQDLYKAYEVMAGGPERFGEFHTKLGVLQSEFDRFKDAVHNPEVTGDWARHGHPQKLNSKAPMLQKEATEFVRDVAKMWLRKIVESKK